MLAVLHSLALGKIIFFCASSCILSANVCVFIHIHTGANTHQAPWSGNWGSSAPMERRMKSDCTTMKAFQLSAADSQDWDQRVPFNRKLSKNTIAVIFIILCIKGYYRSIVVWRRCQKLRFQWPHFSGLAMHEGVWNTFASPLLKHIFVHMAGHWILTGCNP